MSPDSADTATDGELLEVAEAAPLAFEEFFARHVDAVARFAATRVSDPAGAADVIATTFLVVLASASSFDAGRDEPVGWLLGIADRVTEGLGRPGSRERTPARTQRGGWRPPAARDGTPHGGIDGPADGLMHSAGALRPPDREALRLIGDDGLTPVQASGVLGISPIGFRRRLTAARRSLEVTGGAHARPTAVPPLTAVAPVADSPAAA